mgnify:CR=1 FL=1
MTIELGPINNGACNFELEEYIDSVGSADNPLTIGLFFFAPFVFQMGFGSDYSVVSDGKFMLSSSDYSLNGQTRTVYVVVKSLILASDTISQTFSFEITYIGICATTGL